MRYRKKKLSPICVDISGSYVGSCLVKWGAFYLYKNKVIADFTKTPTTRQVVNYAKLQ